MTTTKFYSIVKSRLNRHGFKGFVKADYQRCADSIGIADLNNPTESELTQAVVIMSNYKNESSQLTVIDTNEGDIKPEIEEPSILDTFDIEKHQANKNAVDVITERADDIKHLADESLNSSDISSPELPAPLTVAEKNDLVTQQIVALNKVALQEDVTFIVADINETSNSDSMFLMNIKSAVLAYFKHTDNQFQSGVDSTLKEIQQAVDLSKNFRSRTVEKAITNIKQEVLASGRDWKSQRDEVESLLLQILTHPSVG